MHYDKKGGDMLKEGLGYLYCKTMEFVNMRIAESKLKYYQSLPYRYRAMTYGIKALKHVQNAKKKKSC